METENEIVFDEGVTSENDEVENLSNRVVHYDPTRPEISTICENIRKEKIVTDPDFQRRYVWPNPKATRLIESILMRIPLPIVYMAESEDGRKRVVIDGQQRLQSIYKFRNGDFKLGKMSAFPELTGKKYSELGEELMERIDTTGIQMITFSKDCDPELKFNVFERLNTGAVSLNDQELRNCIYRGEYNKLLKELADDADFRLLLGLKGEEKRMKDVELVLRFAAFYHKSYLNYKSPIKSFLNEDMRLYLHIGDRDANQLRDAFKKAVSLIKSMLYDGDVSHAFKRFYPGSEGSTDGRWESRNFNASLYDILMWSFARHDKNLVMHNLEAIREAYIDLMTTDNEFIEAIEKSTSSVLMVRKRFKKWDDRMEAILHAQDVQPRCFSRELKERLYAQNPVCGICRQRIASIDDAAVDHIEQYWLGGQTIDANARLAHRYCNCARPRNR